MPFEGGDFDSWLEQGLDKALNAQSGPNPLATQASYHAAYLSGGVGMSLGSSITAALTSGKLVVGAATASIIVGGGAAIAASTSGGDSSNGIASFVRLCQSQAASSGVHGIGQCVASYARHHGQGASEAREHGKASETHGKASEAHGKASEARNSHAGGNSGSSHGQGKSDTGKPDGAGDNAQGSGNSGSHGDASKR